MTCMDGPKQVAWREVILAQSLWLEGTTGFHHCNKHSVSTILALLHLGANRFYTCLGSDDLPVNNSLQS
jgi:hypothetical protein